LGGSYTDSALCLYELSGASSSPLSASGEGSASTVSSVSSINYNAGAFLVAGAGAYEQGGYGNYGTSGFTIDETASDYYNIEHLTNPASSGSQTFQMSEGEGGSQYWAESAAVFNPT
jgi:hypothetical protein